MLEKLIDLVRDSGFNPIVNEQNVQVYNHDNEIIGQFKIMNEHKLYFNVFDPSEDQITLEGGECSFDYNGVREVIEEFNYRD